MISEYYKYWTIKLHNMVSDQEKRCHSLRIAENQNKSNGILHEKRMKVFRGGRKIYLFINRTKYQYFSCQPNILKLWRTISKKRNYLSKQVDNRLMNKLYNEKERKYLMLFKKTLEKYDSSYGLQIGLILHRVFNRDVALIINEFLM